MTMRLTKALGAGITLAALIAGPPWLLVAYIGNPWPAEGISLMAPLTDNAIIGVLAAIVWLLWAQLTACIVAEALAAFSNDRIQIRVAIAFGVQQQLARRLVTAIVIATAVTPLAAGTAIAANGHGPATLEVTAGSVARAQTSQTSQGQLDSEDQPGTPTSVQRRQQASEGAANRAGASSAHRWAVGSASTTSTVTVMRLDSLWSIAERVLGVGDRWTEIAALNDGHAMNDGSTFLSADHIKPGWQLLVPGGDAGDPTTTQSASTSAGAPGETHSEVVVRKGDTLSEIAQHELGDAGAYPQIFSASTDIIQPDGRRLLDPNVIDVGWTLHIADDVYEATPAAPQQPAPTHERPRAPGQQPSEVRPDQTQPAQADEPPPPADDPGVDSRAAEQGERNAQGEQGAAAHTADESEKIGDFTALRALLASAACLSVGALGLLTANRRRRVRRRRVGRMIAPTPQELSGVDQAILEHGSDAQEHVVFLDRALRHVAACCQAAGDPLPPLGAAVLGAEELTLLFTCPATGDVPDGWSASEDVRAWMLPRSTFLEPDLQTQPAPYPALVSVGQDEDGRTWLLDLETMGACGIGGDPAQVANLMRFMVAELAVNAWSEGSEVMLADGFGAETIGLNPARLRQVHRRDAFARASVLTGELGQVERNLAVDILTRRRDGLLLDSTTPVVVVVDTRPEESFVAELEARDRSRVVVVYGDDDAPAVEVSGDGMAHLPIWGISVRAYALASSEAEVMAALLASTRNTADVPVSDPEGDDGPLGKYARVDGSLREEYTQPRRPGGGDPFSVLPEADEVYLATAATTTEDLAAVAPSTSARTRAAIASDDATLDNDVADWFDESSPRPKVHVLGPVEVTALDGGDPNAIDNLGGTVSFIAYLACQERGVTGERAAAAFGWKTQKTVQNRATNARFLLGRSTTGSDWLPDASTSRCARSGTPTYALVRSAGGVLCSADLFCRLRARGQSRGDGCEDDLVTALSLVTGAPFEAATDRRYPWLFQGRNHDEVLVGAIQDAAHVMASRAVVSGRTDLVRLACDAARRASPHSDIPWLDQAAAIDAESGHGAADELVRREIVDRIDEDLPPRTEVILDQRDWATG